MLATSELTRIIIVEVFFVFFWSVFQVSLLLVFLSGLHNIHGKKRHFLSPPLVAPCYSILDQHRPLDGWCTAQTPARVVREASDLPRAPTHLPPSPTSNPNHPRTPSIYYWAPRCSIMF